MKEKEFWKRIKEDLINRARCSVETYPLHGDSGYPVYVYIILK